MICAEGMKKKEVIYQLFPRLFGNNNSNPVPYGSLEQNGSGKFSDINNNALQSLNEMGVTHIWYTGILEHATESDYSSIGISRDNPAVVKGRAGSPYAVKDYYDVDPDLASEPANRMDEFRDLVKRTKKIGLKVIIDFVPNHVARSYFSDNLPAGHHQLGQHDDPSESFLPDNNFYYFPGKRFVVPKEALQECKKYTDLLKIRPFYEYPAKASGNDCFNPTPAVTDWYETVKLNYGKEFDQAQSLHYTPIPATWYRMMDILTFWAEFGIDGFRCDMAEMVPVEFWNWAVTKIKSRFPTISFTAEVYNPILYNDYLTKGKFDFLYDKVGLYDTLKKVTMGEADVTTISACWQSLDGIDNKMLRFMENHDEQRIASDFFTGNAKKALPAVFVSACMSAGPFMLYNGQELGEKGDRVAGFSGNDGRTTIFDYWVMPEVQKWNNEGAFTTHLLSDSQKLLRLQYSKILQLCRSEAISEGAFYDLLWINTHLVSQQIYAFLRHTKKEKMLFIASFNANEVQTHVDISEHAIAAINLDTTNDIECIEELYLQEPANFSYKSSGKNLILNLSLAPFESKVFRIKVKR